MSVDFYGEQIANLPETLLQIRGDILTMYTELQPLKQCTADHSVRVAYYAYRLVQFAGTSESERLKIITFSGLLHDYGKTDPEVAALINVNGDRPLTAEEILTIGKHVQTGRDSLIKAGLPAIIPLVAEQHHRNFDGGGYPKAISTTWVVPEASMIAYVDRFDAAISSGRMYGVIKTPLEMFEYIEEKVGSEFDPQHIGAFLRFKDWYLKEGAGMSLAQIKTEVEDVLKYSHGKL